jgi:hypothetical protein
MSGFYDGAAGRRTYLFPAETISSAAVLQRIHGPAGRIGRIVGFEYMITTTVTTAAPTITVDTNAGLTAPFATTVAVAAANNGGAATAAQLSAGDELPADTTIEISSDAVAGAGAADLILTVAWY